MLTQLLFESTKCLAKEGQLAVRDLGRMYVLSSFVCMW